MAAQAQSHARSIYRAILRELPARTPTLSPSPIREGIRSHFLQSSSATSTAPTSSNTSTSDESFKVARRQEAEQFAQYLKAQRVYGELLDRYNPGMNMDEEERVRLSARRVGMEMPVEWKK